MKINKWRDEWRDEWMNELMYEWMNEWMMKLDGIRNYKCNELLNSSYDWDFFKNKDLIFFLTLPFFTAPDGNRRQRERHSEVCTLLWIMCEK